MPHKTARPQVLTFDLDDTLWDNGPVIKTAIEASYRYLTDTVNIRPIDDSDIEVAKTQVLERQASLAFDLTTLREQYYKQVLSNKGIGNTLAATVAKDATALFMDLRSQVTPFPEAEHTLARLAEQYRLGAITNGNCRFHEQSISRHFSFTVSPLEAQAAKPQPAIYEYAAKAHGYALDRAVHIGDCETNDVSAAHQAGCQTVWYNPSYKGTSAIATWQIHSLTELVDIFIETD